MYFYIFQIQVRFFNRYNNFDGKTMMFGLFAPSTWKIIWKFRQKLNFKSETCGPNARHVGIRTCPWAPKAPSECEILQKNTPFLFFLNTKLIILYQNESVLKQIVRMTRLFKPHFGLNSSADKGTTLLRSCPDLLLTEWIKKHTREDTWKILRKIKNIFIFIYIYMFP